MTQQWGAATMVSIAVPASRSSGYRPHGCRPSSPSVAREAGGSFHVPAALQESSDQLVAVIDAYVATDLDELADEVVRDLLRTTQRQLDRLTALRVKATGVLQSRLVSAAGPSKVQRGVRETQEFLQHDLRLAPSEAKKTAQAGKRLKFARETRDAFGKGDLGQEHVRVITDTLQHLGPGARRDEVERTLVRAAATQDPVALGRTARRLLADADYGAAVVQDARRHGKRYLRMAQLPDGGVALHALLYGLQAERAMTAIKAFERFDAPGDQRRTPEQRAADALDEVFDSALRAGDAPAQHGVRPHVEVVVHYSDLARQAGIAELGFTGPITIAEIRQLLVDSTICRVVAGPESMPLEVGKKTRHVPAALWTALKLRDGGCAWRGCDAPAGWCEVAHGTNPFRAGGRLSLDNAALLCKRHHRIFDHGSWTIRIDGAVVTFSPP